MKTLANSKQARLGNFPSIFDDFFFGEEFKPRSHRSSFPSVNIKDEEKAFTLEFAVPGYSKDELSINVENDLLTISSERKNEEEVNEEGYTRKEFSFSSFSRSFTLPESVDIDNIDAKTQDGVLFVTLPKKDELLKDKVKKIAIQ